jgi:hypothetical protein
MAIRARREGKRGRMPLMAAIVNAMDVYAMFASASARGQARLRSHYRIRA